MKGLLYLILFMLPLVLGAQEIWRIDDISIEIEGKTRESALRKFLGIEVGDEFSTFEDCEKKLSMIRISIKNNRIFKEESDLEWKEIDFNKGVHSIVLDVTIFDTFNIIVLPKPGFNTNSGWELSLNAKNYNFLGYMRELSMDVEYTSENSNLVFSLELPINNFSFKLDYEMESLSEDLQFNNNLFFSTAYQWDLYIAHHPFILTAMERLYVLPQGDDDFSYLETVLSFGSSWELPWVIYENFKPVYSATLKGTTAYLPSLNPEISDYRDRDGDGDSEGNGLYFTFNHSFSLGGLSWNGNNYREGQLYQLGNNLEYHIDSDIIKDLRWEGNIWASAESHFDWYPFGAAIRLRYDHKLLKQAAVGEYFRGILDNNLIASDLFVLNSAFYITLWNWDKLWELNGGPFFDVGYMLDVPEGQDPYAFTLGLEGLAYPSAIRSIYARLTLGLDIQRIILSEQNDISLLTDNLEIFFGLGGFY